MAELIRLLNTVGKKSFVDFYEEYKNLFLLKDHITMEKKLLVAKKLLNENSEAKTESGQLTRINAAIRIFNMGQEKEALEIIHKSTHPKITPAVKQRASQLLNEELTTT